MFRSHDVNQKIEATGLKKRHKGKSKYMDENRDKIGTKARIIVRIRIRMRVIITIEVE
jgi:hypothetical protein